MRVSHPFPVEIPRSHRLTFPFRLRTPTKTMSRAGTRRLMDPSQAGKSPLRKGPPSHTKSSETALDLLPGHLSVSRERVKLKKRRGGIADTGRDFA